MVNRVRRMNEVNARRARLVPGWVTVFGRVYIYTISVCNQPARSTQSCIPPGSLNRVPASAGGRGGIVTSVGWQVTLSDLIWHMSSRLAVLDPRVGHTIGVLSPFIFVSCHSD